MTKKIPTLEKPNVPNKARKNFNPHVENIVKLKSRIAKLKPLINDTRAIVNDSSPEILDKLMTLQKYKNDIT